MQVAPVHSRPDLRPIERGSETIRFPRPAELVGQDRSGSLGNAREHVAQFIVERNDSLASPPALSRGKRDCALSEMRPEQARQVTQTQACVSGKIDRVLDFLWTRLVYAAALQLLKVRLCP